MFGAATGILKEVSTPCDTHTNQAQFAIVAFILTFCICWFQGARHYSGLEEAMLRNIDAVQQLSGMTKSALGPHGKSSY